MTMTHPPILVPVSRLTLAPQNVRKSYSGEADTQLKASIAARGVLQNLVGLAVPRRRGHFSIIAGGRRLRAVQALIAEGTLTDNYALPVLPLPDRSQIVEVSLDENFQKLGMNPADECAAFGQVIADGATVDDIAKRFGVTTRFVLGRLRLAALAPCVFEALRDGILTLDAAQAFAATADTELQAQVFAREQASFYNRFSPASIRRQVLDGGVRGTDPRARLIGAEAYEAAGGRIEADLFDEAGAETWIDTEILDRLASERMAALAEELRASAGLAEVRVSLDSSLPWHEVRELPRVRGSVPEPSPEAITRIDALTAELEQLEAAAEGADEDGPADEVWERIEALTDELDTLSNPRPELTPEQRASAIAFLVLGDDGEPRLHHEYFTAKAVPQPSVIEGDNPAVDDAPAGAVSPRLSQRLLGELAVQRTEVLAVHVAADTALALDLASFLMVERALNHSGSELPSTLSAERPVSPAAEFDSGSPAAGRLAALDAALDRSWTSATNVTERYDAFCALAAEARSAWLGWAVARTLKAVPEGGSGEALLRHLGIKLGIDAAASWRPTAANYFDRVPKAVTLAALEEVGGSDLRQRYAGMKKSELGTVAERLFRGDVVVEPAVRERALGWLPVQMMFGDPAADPAQPRGGGAALTADAPEAPVAVEQEDGAADIAA